MTQKETKELQERCYAIGNSKLPLDTFFNDIRDNPNPNFNKESAYEDLKLIVDEIYRLKEKEKPMKVNKIDWTATVIYRCVKCGKKITNGNYCINCGQALDWSVDDE